MNFGFGFHPHFTGDGQRYSPSSSHGQGLTHYRTSSPYRAPPPPVVSNGSKSKTSTSENDTKVPELRPPTANERITTILPITHDFPIHSSPGPLSIGIKKVSTPADRPPGPEPCLPTPPASLPVSPTIGANTADNAMPSISPLMARLRSRDVDSESLELNNLSRSAWAHLDRSLSMLGRADPLYRLRYSYISDTTTFIVRCMPSPVHQAFHGFLSTTLPNTLDEQNGLPSSSMRCFTITGDSDVRNFIGSYAGSVKQADLMIVPVDKKPWRVSNGGFPSLAVEIGFSEDHPHLMKDMELWLRGSGGKVRVVVLVKLTETPKPRLQALVHDRDFDPGPPGSQSDESYADDLSINFGPLHRQGHCMVGWLTGFIEMWRLGPDGTPYQDEAARKTVLPEPESADIAQEEDALTLTILDLFGLEENIPPGHLPDEKIMLPMGEYRIKLAMGMETLAMNRLDKVRSERAKLAGEDGEWVNEDDGDNGGERRAPKRVKRV